MRRRREEETDKRMYKIMRHVPKSVLPPRLREAYGRASKHRDSAGGSSH